MTIVINGGIIDAMKDLYVSKIIKLIIGMVLCFLALLLPYKARMIYTKILAFFIHLPFVIFGTITRYLFKKLKINPNDINWK